MHRVETTLPGVCVLEPRVFGDARGFFMETYQQARFEALGITERFVQDNHSSSVRGTLRGLHYQLHFPQAKLCRVIRGEVLDIAVDIRRSSPHFAQWVGVLLSADNKRQAYIPAGFAHGFVVLSEEAEFLYKCSEVYHPEDERGLAWNDPQIGIQWGITEPLLSDKDRQNPTLATASPDLLPLYRGTLTGGRTI
jgi:dTDP-4-dehydrorhamnose 3,5-epimerase